MSPQSRDHRVEDAPSEREIALSILLESEPSRLMETYYIAREPGLLPALRWLGSLSEEARGRLGNFIAAAKNHDVRVERSDRTTLVLKLIPVEKFMVPKSSKNPSSRIRA